jgi:hypothetical protein
MTAPDSRVSQRRGSPIAKPGQEALEVRALRALRRIVQFGGLVWEAVLHPDPLGVAPPDPFLPTSPDDEVLRALAPSRRPASTALEAPFPHEAALVERMARLAAQTVLDNYRQAAAATPGARALRDQHAKAHGCVNVEFVVLDHLPPDLLGGIFQPGHRYRAVARFSNGAQTPQSDRKCDGRGLALKLLDVPEPTILSELVPGQPAEQDFIFGTYPVFFLRNVDDYAQFMDAAKQPRQQWRQKVVYIAKWAVFGATHLRLMLILLATITRRVSDPLSVTYHSMSAYAFGDQVVRYMVALQGGQDLPGDAERGRSDGFLRAALIDDLDLARDPGRTIVLDFFVQLRHAASRDDVEDVSRRWTHPLDRTIRLAEVRIRPQAFATPEQDIVGDNRAFNPWNCLRQHRPLGSLNRMRLAVYLASREARRKLNMLTP